MGFAVQALMLLFCYIMETPLKWQKLYMPKEGFSCHFLINVHAAPGATRNETVVEFAHKRMYTRGTAKVDVFLGKKPD